MVGFIQSNLGTYQTAADDDNLIAKQFRLVNGCQGIDGLVQSRDLR